MIFENYSNMNRSFYRFPKLQAHMNEYSRYMYSRVHQAWALNPTYNINGQSGIKLSEGVYLLPSTLKVY